MTTAQNVRVMCPKCDSVMTPQRKCEKCDTTQPDRDAAREPTSMRDVWAYVQMRWGSVQPWDEHDRAAIDKILSRHRSSREAELERAIQNAVTSLETAQTNKTIVPVVIDSLILALGENTPNQGKVGDCNDPDRFLDPNGEVAGSLPNRGEPRNATPPASVKAADAGEYDYDSDHAQRELVCMLTAPVSAPSTPSSEQVKELREIADMIEKYYPYHWNGCSQFQREADADRVRSAADTIERLEAWKREATDVEATWDVQAVGKIIGVPLGGDIRAAIQPAIESLTNSYNEAYMIAVAAKNDAEALRSELAARDAEIERVKEAIADARESIDDDAPINSVASGCNEGIRETCDRIEAALAAKENPHAE